MMKGLILDDNTSNLTFASGHDEIISGSSSSRNELSMAHQLYPTLPQPSSASTTTHPPPPPNPPPPKKKRNLPGNPDPEAEVIALSPKALLATNRFVCEVCKKGFQRDQNLQLHRRGHNLPWKLKQRSNKDVVKKKVYVCPEVTCVHHDPSRALGDLTGIKKHFFRKHGEKKWKCEKCSKRYAVHSDWKAHSKICGTREYRCDCGTLFSRRDSFITHRAFCDALAQETTSTTNNLNARSITALNNINNNNNPFLFSTSSPSQQLVLQSQLDSQLYGLSSLVKREHHDSVVNAVPQWLMSSSPNVINLTSSQPPLFSHHHSSSNNNPNVGLSDHNSFMQGLTQKPNNPSSATGNQQSSSSAFTSATALLQKAAQIGATMSSSNNNRSSSSSSSSQFLGTSSAGMMPNSGGQNNMILMEDPNALGIHYDVMGSFEGSDNNSFLEAPPLVKARDDGLTRDFLGLQSFPRREYFSMAGLDHRRHLNSSPSFTDHHDPQKNQEYEDPQQTSWQG